MIHIRTAHTVRRTHSVDGICCCQKIKKNAACRLSTPTCAVCAFIHFFVGGFSILIKEKYNEKKNCNQEEVAIRFQSFVVGQRELQILVCVGGGDGDVCVSVCVGL